MKGFKEYINESESNNVVYYVSSGAGNAQHTLRVKRNGADEYVTNLGTGIQQAIVRAKNYVEQMREGGENAYFCDGPSNHLKPYRNK